MGEIEGSEDQIELEQLEGVWGFISELVLWKDVAKSTFWFGCGSLCFVSSCFSKNGGFNIISVMSHIGLLILAVSFFFDSFAKRGGDRQERRRRIQLNEDDILRFSRFVLPTVNAGIALTQDFFSGEPSMTLKVAPFLLFASKYGHMITLWRLFAAGFFFSFTLPKLYTCYAHQIKQPAVAMISHASQAWKACQHKKIAAISAGTFFWNMFGVKTRILAAFFAIVMVRCHRQFCQVESPDEDAMMDEQQEQQQSSAMQQ